MRILIKKNEGAFFHSGLILFLLPTTIIGLRYMDYMLFEGEWVRLSCSISLLASVVCFMVTYYAEEI